MKVLSVVGNQPQFIKSAPLSVALHERGIEEVTLHTGRMREQCLFGADGIRQRWIQRPDLLLSVSRAR